MENLENSGEQKDLKQAYRTAYLIAGFLKQNLTEEEKDELDEWILASDENMILFEKMTDEKNVAQAAAWFRKMNVEQDLAETKRKIAIRKPQRLWQYIAAASVIIATAAGIYLYQNSIRQKNQSEVAVQKQDIMPGSNKATLTLGDGKIIDLGKVGDDTTINGRVKILRKDGQLIYEPAVADNEIVYNTLTVPRKGQYKLVLPDGSKVWLNSESSIRYPVSFSTKERKVFVTGETFFEVAKDKTKPFRVVAGDVMVEALGTQFNVNAYTNEPFFSATLIEGSIRVSKGSEVKILKPSQQAQLTNAEFRIVDMDNDDAMAWKNNQFKFTNTSIEEIMRQIARWYDADIVYQDNVTLHLNATIGRDVPVSKLLNILEATNEVHFKIENKKIIVMN